jgi:phosphatidylserine decarboxylase
MRLDIDPEEAELPLDAYPTLDAFFTRRLRAGARPIDPDPEHLISPADGRLLVYRDVGRETFRVKRSVVSLPLLAGSEAAARPFVGGTVFVVRLAPGDYHRFHFPDSGSTPRATRLGSTLHSVHTIALDYGAPAFRNRRDLTPFSSEHFGPLLLIEIGALFVGSIVQTCEPGRVRRGAEKGYFHFGGSTVVVVAAPGSLRPDEDLVASSAAGVETLVQMGTAIASRV